MYRATLCFGNSIVNRTTATHVASTCATGYASVFTIGGLYVACFGRCLGKGVSLGSICKPSAGRALAKPVAHKTWRLSQSARRQSRQPWANAQRLMEHACYGIRKSADVR